MITSTDRHHALAFRLVAGAGGAGRMESRNEDRTNARMSKPKANTAKPAGANERDFWTSAPTIKRTSRYLDSLKTALSLTNTQVRNLLIAADDEQD